jgi:hypothetical protein
LQAIYPAFLFICAADASGVWLCVTPPIKARISCIFGFDSQPNRG